MQASVNNFSVHVLYRQSLVIGDPVLRGLSSDDNNRIFDTDLRLSALSLVISGGEPQLSAPITKGQRYYHRFSVVGNCRLSSRCQEQNPPPNNQGLPVYHSNVYIYSIFLSCILYEIYSAF